jgi:pimeloyl-ACP methyl ester carboxylesterase
MTSVSMITVGGCEIRYELLGSGPTVVLTPGQRSGGGAVRATAELLAERCRVVMWDRRNTGSSHVWFGTQPEQLVWADDLAVLLRELGLGPAILAGVSAGARVSYLAAIRHPEVAAGLALWNVSGGPYASQVLGYVYHTPFINEALRAGMVGIAETPFFRERIEANPANRDIILGTSAEEFITALRRWNEFFYHKPDMPVTGATVDELRTITCPTLIFEGKDDTHAPEAAIGFHEAVSGSELVPAQWTTEEWMNQYMRKSYTGVETVLGGGVTDLYTRVVPTVLEFVDRVGSDGAPR